MIERAPERSILEIVREIVAALTDIPPNRIVPEALWTELLDDRMDFYGILADTQRAFSIEIPDDDAFDMQSVGDLIAFVSSRGR